MKRAAENAHTVNTRDGHIIYKDKKPEALKQHILTSQLKIL